MSKVECLRAGVSDRDDVPAVGLVAHEDVQMPKLGAGGLDEGSGRHWVSQVTREACDASVPRLHCAQIVQQCLNVIGDPVLDHVVRAMMVDDKAGAHRGEP